MANPLEKIPTVPNAKQVRLHQYQDNGLAHYQLIWLRNGFQKNLFSYQIIFLLLKINSPGKIYINNTGAEINVDTIFNQHDFFIANTTKAFKK